MQARVVVDGHCSHAFIARFKGEMTAIANHAARNLISWR
jgi:hypothetical protein